MKKQIVSNIVSHYVLNVVGMALGFLLIPFLIGRIGREAFGLIVLAESMMSFFEVLTISLRIAISRHATVAAAGGDDKRFAEYLSTGHAVMAVCAATAVGIGAAIAAGFPSVFRVPAGLETESRVLFLMVVVSFAWSVRNTAYWSALYAKQRFDLIHTSASAGLVIRAAALFALYGLMPKGGASLVPYAAVGLGMAIGQNAIIRFWHERLLPGVVYSIMACRRERLREILSFAGHTSVARLGQVLYGDTANLLINLWWGPAANAIFALSAKFPELIRRFLIEPTWSLTPTFTDLAARQERRSMETLFFSYSKGLAIVGFPICFVIALLADPLMNLWLGPGYEEAAQLVPLNMLWLFFGIPFALIGCVLNAYARVRVPSYVSLCSAVLHVFLCVLLGRTFGMGLAGMALAGALASSLLPNLFFPLYVCRTAGFPLARYWGEVFAKPFALSALICAGGISALRAGGAHGPALVAMGGGLMLLSYAAAAALLLTRDEKKLAADTLRLGLGRLGLTATAGGAR